MAHLQRPVGPRFPCIADIAQVSSVQTANGRNLTDLQEHVEVSGLPALGRQSVQDADVTRVLPPVTDGVVGFPKVTRPGPHLSRQVAVTKAQVDPLRGYLVYVAPIAVDNALYGITRSLSCPAL